MFDPNHIAAEPPVSFERAKRYFTESLRSTHENDQLCLRDAAFFHGDQLSAEHRKKLLDRNQPPVIVNRIQPAISGMLGFIDGTETQPECFPNDPDDQNAADISTKVLRSFSQQGDLNRVKRIYSEDNFIYGTCAVLVGEDAKRGDSKFNVRPILWEDFFYDPYSRDHDFADARYLGLARWCDADEVQSAYPHAYEALGSPFNGADIFDIKDSAERFRLWIDCERKRIRVIEMYLADRNGEWQKLVFCEAGFLDFGPSPYRDDDGHTLCPIVAVSYQIDRQTGFRYGPIRNAIHCQEEYNSRRSKLLHVTNSRQVQIIDANADPADKELARQEAAKPNGVMPFGYGVVPTNDIFSGNAQLLQQTERDLDRYFPTPAVLSRFDAGDSGRAMQVLQQAGLTEWARALSRLEALELQVFKRLWWCAKQFMTEQDAVRITNEARAPEFAHVNVPIIATRPTLVPDPATGQPRITQRNLIVGIKNELAKMDVDIHIATVPKTETLEQEVWAETLRYAASLQISPLDPRFLALLEIAPIPDKTRLIERIKSIQAQQQQVVAEQQQKQAAAAEQAQELQQAEAMAKVHKEHAQANKAQAEAALTELETLHAAHAATRVLNGAPLMPQMQSPPTSPPPAAL